MDLIHAIRAVHGRLSCPVVAVSCVWRICNLQWCGGRGLSSLPLMFCYFFFYLDEMIHNSPICKHYKICRKW